MHGFFESARVAYMRGLFPDIDPMGRAGGFGMIFAETHVRFASPGFYEEDVRVDVKPIELRRSSVKLAFQMVCEGDERLVAEGWGTLVGYDYEHGRAQRLPGGHRGAAASRGRRVVRGHELRTELRRDPGRVRRSVSAASSSRPPRKASSTATRTTRSRPSTTRASGSRRPARCCASRARA